MATDSVREAQRSIPEELFEGNRLDQPTFHRLYERTPPQFKAELIGGVVHVASPLRMTHGRINSLLVAWLRAYRRATPGTDVLDNATVILSDGSEPQPDACLRYEKGTSRASDEDYCVGPPELIAEVSHSTMRHDLVEKCADYEQNGATEYLVLVVPEARAVWFVRDEVRGFAQISAIGGILRSHVFPGLWLDAEALFQMDDDRVMAVLEEGLASVKG